MKVLNTLKKLSKSNKTTDDKASCGIGCRKCCFLCNLLFVLVVSTIVSIVVSKINVSKNVKKVIEDDPRFIIEALQKMEMNERKQQRENATKKAPEIAKQIANAENRPYIGNKNGSKIIVEFFDYACGHCKRQSVDLKKLVNEDENVKVIMADLPILSENSLHAASLGIYISLKNSNKFADYYAMANKGGIDDNSLKNILSSIGLPTNYLDKAKQDKDVKKILESNYSYARELQLQGTPALIVNGTFIGGAVQESDLKAMLK